MLSMAASNEISNVQNFNNPSPVMGGGEERISDIEKLSNSLQYLKLLGPTPRFHFNGFA